jgi:pimeloyl-ACP methyl ester carboxylesterase
MQRADLEIDDDGRRLRLAWVEWGARDAAHTVVCVHGLTRNARDFDALAHRLAQTGARVLCVDVPGRGASGWLDDPMRYTVPVYARQLAAWLDALRLARVDWVGTSMGGLIALELARTQPERLHRLVLNDIGPFVAKETLAPIKAYLGLDLVFASLDALEAHLRTIHAGFGPLADQVWRHLAEHSARRVRDGWRLHYDPRIREPFLAVAEQDIDMWEAWQGLSCPVLVLRGAQSTILDAATAERMTQTGPRARLVTFEGIGHAPALFDPTQIAVVVGFLLEPGADRSSLPEEGAR